MKKKYPLSQIAEIKKRRLEEAEKILKEKREALTHAEAELTKRREALNTTQKLKLDLIQKHYESIKEGTTSSEIERHETYIQEVINVKLAEEKKRVEEQKKVVREAEIALENARTNRLQKQQELEKIHMHKEEWKKEVKKEIEIEEAALSDELGTSMHARKMKKRS